MYFCKYLSNWLSFQELLIPVVHYWLDNKRVAYEHRHSSPFFNYYQLLSAIIVSHLRLTKVKHLQRRIRPIKFGFRPETTLHLESTPTTFR